MSIHADPQSIVCTSEQSLFSLRHFTVLVNPPSFRSLYFNRLPYWRFILFLLCCKAAILTFTARFWNWKWKVKRCRTTLLHRRKSKEAYQVQLSIKVDSRRIGQNSILYLKHKIHRDNYVVMFVPVLCPVLFSPPRGSRWDVKCHKAEGPIPSEEIKGFKINEDIKQLWFQKTRRYFERAGNSWVFTTTLIWHCVYS